MGFHGISWDFEIAQFLLISFNLWWIPFQGSNDLDDLGYPHFRTPPPGNLHGYAEKKKLIVIN
jgi:hypothetical protein